MQHNETSHITLYVTPRNIAEHSMQHQVTSHITLNATPRDITYNTLCNTTRHQITNHVTSRNIALHSMQHLATSNNTSCNFTQRRITLYATYQQHTVQYHITYRGIRRNTNTVTIQWTLIENFTRKTRITATLH